MAGESFREIWQIAKEATYGTIVPATRQLSGESSGHLNRTRANHEIRVSTGTRDNVRGNKPRAVTAGGAFSQAFDADEIIELFLAAIQGGVTPVTALGASTWVFTPSTTLDSQVWEWFDGYNGWVESGVYIDTLKFTWSAAANGRYQGRGDAVRQGSRAADDHGSVDNAQPDLDGGLGDTGLPGRPRRHPPVRHYSARQSAAP